MNSHVIRMGFTQGQWFRGLEKYSPDLVHTRGPDGSAEKLVLVGRAQPDGNFEEAIANATLGAAAIDLLEQVILFRQLTVNDFKNIRVFLKECDSAGYEYETYSVALQELKSRLKRIDSALEKAGVKKGRKGRDNEQ